MSLYGIDTEFMEDGRTIELISLTLVDAQGHSLYLQNRNAMLCNANPWVAANVLQHLQHRACKPRQNNRRIGRGPAHCAKQTCPWIWHDQIADCLCAFVAADCTPPQWIGYYSAYDHIALCQCFGTMMDLPPGWPMYMQDLRQLLDAQGLEDVMQPDDMPHNALSDAQWIVETYQRYIAVA